MNNLSDEALIEAYKRAYELNLDPDFIHILKVEIEKRQIKLTYLNQITDK